MSINQVVAGLMTVAGLTGVSAFAMTNPTIQADIKNVQTAIANKDLTGYKTAKTQLITDQTKVQTDKVNATTQDQLNTMADHQAKSKARMTALTNNDLNEFNANSGKQVDQATFDKMVANNKTRMDEMNKLSDTIKNNDFNTFKTLEQTNMSMKGNKGNRGNKNNKYGQTRTAPTDAQLQTKFDQMVSDYKANGTLPNQMMDKMMEGGEGFGHKSGRGENNWN